jgi:alpha-methylacyl-CoA racemase
VAVGALEPQFFAALLAGLGLDTDEVGPQHDRGYWPAMRRLFADRFQTRTRDEWERHFAGSDACVAPVLSMAEAPEHKHNRARGTFVDIAGVIQPGPAPRFSTTPAVAGAGPPAPGDHTDDVAAAAGFSQDEIVKLRDIGAIA